MVAAAEQAARQGRQRGAALLWMAITRSSRSELAVYALAVDAEHERVEAFYQHFGFISLESLKAQLIPVAGR